MKTAPNPNGEVLSMNVTGNLQDKGNISSPPTDNSQKLVSDNIISKSINPDKIKADVNKFLPQEQNNESLSESDQRLHDILMRTRIDPFEPDELEPVCLEIIQGDKVTTLATRGNFSMITGKAKSRKTFFHTFLMAAWFTPGTLCGIFKATILFGKEGCIFFDTEQGKVHTKKVAKRVLKLSGYKGEHFHTHKFREENLNDKIAAIEFALRTMPNIGLVVIDGVRDLSPDINDSQQSLETATRLLQLSSKYNLHIIVVLHQNKGDNSARGHLGAELQNKAESTVSVTKEGDISIVAPEYCRDRDFELFAFGIDADGIPEPVSDWKNQNVKGDKVAAITPLTMDKEVLKRVLHQVYANEAKFKYSDLQSNLKNAFESEGFKIALSKLRDFITYYKTEGFLKTEGTPGTRYFFYLHQ